MAARGSGYTYALAREEEKLKARRWALDDTKLTAVQEPAANGPSFTSMTDLLEAQFLPGESNLKPQSKLKCTNVSFSDEGSTTARIVNEGRYAAYILGFGQDHLAAIGCDHGVLDALPDPDFLEKFGCSPSAYAQGGIKAALKAQRENEWMVTDKIGFMAMRTSWCDDYFERFARDYSDQSPNFVVLGGGWDFRLLRLAFLRQLDSDASFFEVDAPGTQKLKLEALEKAIESGKYAECTHENRDAITYVTCDFTQESWFDNLIKAGLDVSKPTAFLMEGITYYIPEAAVRANLHILSSKFADVPATIAFDYPSPQMLKFIQPIMIKIGEPWLFSATGDSMEKIVQECNLNVLENLAPENLLEVYLPYRKSDGLPVSYAIYTKMFLVAGNKNVKDKEL